MILTAPCNQNLETKTWKVLQLLQLDQISTYRHYDTPARGGIWTSKAMEKRLTKQEKEPQFFSARHKSHKSGCTWAMTAGMIHTCIIIYIRMLLTWLEEGLCWKWVRVGSWWQAQRAGCCSRGWKRRCKHWWRKWMCRGMHRMGGWKGHRRRCWPWHRCCRRQLLPTWTGRKETDEK